MVMGTGGVQQVFSTSRHAQSVAWQPVMSHLTFQPTPGLNLGSSHHVPCPPRAHLGWLGELGSLLLPGIRQGGGSTGQGMGEGGSTVGIKGRLGGLPRPSSSVMAHLSCPCEPAWVGASRWGLGRQVWGKVGDWAAEPKGAGKQ